ncbi:MAG: metal-dependent hydrolase [Hyphomicrobiales bacterium]|nr:metal-dependent hydrolase [Hyphomicrobiales bacterium]MCP5371137.1 metal-dependent hydrolase [Hyphomicrobiales bacterium]
MDSATQFLLGASISGATLGQRLGARALLIGGVVATLPDLDSFLPSANVIDHMTYHRGWSHSVLVHTAVAPVLAAAVAAVVRDAREHWKLLWLTVWLCLVTHAMLDSLTTYGTQILWPLEAGPPVALPSVFIIDPVYTSMLLAGVLIAAFMRERRPAGLRANRVLLLLSTLYLGIGMGAHLVVQARAAADPAFAGKTLHVQPTPFNILFWQVLGVDEKAYVTGLTPLAGCPITQVEVHPRLAQAPRLGPSPSVRRLEWFTDGFYTYQDKGDALAITDLRMGYPPGFVFSFDIGRRDGDGFEATEPSRAPLIRPRRELVGELLDKAARSLHDCLFD